MSKKTHFTVEELDEIWKDLLKANFVAPPRLDRSAWEPCEYCREQDREVYKTQDYPGICSLEVAQDGTDEIVVNAYNHNTPLTKDICFSFPVLFCPKCGRPLTDAAWEMLEKRLEGRQ